MAEYSVILPLYYDSLRSTFNSREDPARASLAAQSSHHAPQ
ncbi:MAG: hypothetical protein NTX48_02990 [Planctomycetales bacterium]|nr:hypothetical protein [Planctomycetales bacterium]